MPKKDITPAHLPVNAKLQDFLLVGAIRNPADPLKGLVGASFTMNVRKSSDA